MCPVRHAGVVPLLCNGIAHPAIYFHLDIRQKRVATDVRVFSVIYSRVSRVGLPFNGTHIMLSRVCDSAPSGIYLDAYLLRKGPPTRGKPQSITRCTQVLSTFPENPFWTRQSRYSRCSIPVCNRSDD